MTSSHLNVILLFFLTMTLYSLPHPSVQNKTVLLLHKLLRKVSPVIFFMSVIASFYFILFHFTSFILFYVYIYVVHIGASVFSCNFHLYYITVFVFVFA